MDEILMTLLQRIEGLNGIAEYVQDKEEEELTEFERGVFALECEALKFYTERLLMVLKGTESASTNM